jgi:hypothetical protein
MPGKRIDENPDSKPAKQEGGQISGRRASPEKKIRGKNKEYSGGKKDNILP